MKNNSALIVDKLFLNSGNGKEKLKETRGKSKNKSRAQFEKKRRI